MGRNKSAFRGLSRLYRQHPPGGKSAAARGRICLFRKVSCPQVQPAMVHRWGASSARDHLPTMLQASGSRYVPSLAAYLWYLYLVLCTLLYLPEGSATCLTLLLCLRLLRLAACTACGGASPSARLTGRAWRGGTKTDPPVSGSILDLKKLKTSRSFAYRVVFRRAQFGTPSTRGNLSPLSGACAQT